MTATLAGLKGIGASANRSGARAHDMMFRGKKHAKLQQKVGKLSAKAETMRTTPSKTTKHPFKNAEKRSGKVQKIEKKIVKVQAKAGKAAEKYSNKSNKTGLKYSIQA